MSNRGKPAGSALLVLLRLGTSLAPRSPLANTRAAPRATVKFRLSDLLLPRSKWHLAPRSVRNRPAINVASRSAKARSFAETGDRSARIFSGSSLQVSSRVDRRSLDRRRRASSGAIRRDRDLKVYSIARPPGQSRRSTLGDLLGDRATLDWREFAIEPWYGGLLNCRFCCASKRSHPRAPRIEFPRFTWRPGEAGSSGL